jgi:nucleotide-binding universal stress UspA family protein
VKTRNKIIVALDLDEQSMIALKYAGYYAEILNFELDVITVVEESSLISRIFSTDDLVIKINQELTNKVNKAVEPFTAKVKVNTHIEHGKPYVKIAELAKKSMPAFIVMGRSEIEKQGMSFLGSNSMHVILESGFPVITIRGEQNYEKYQEENKEILLPLDFRKGVREQVSVAIELAGLLKMPIHLISIQTSGGKGREAKILTQLGITKKTIVEAGIKCSSEMIYEPDKKVYELICREAAKRNAAMIVIMTRDENKLTSLFMGSNALDIIHHADIPVLSVEPWDLEFESPIFSLVSDLMNSTKK